MIQSSIRNRRIIGCGISRDEAERKQRGCLGIYSERGAAGALIEDIEEFYSQLRLGTSEFLNSFFKYVMGNLIEGTTQKNQFCGFYHGYLYQRVESYQDFITGKKGYCKPIWSESNSVAPPCPLAENCKAYKNYLSNQ